MAEVTRQMSWCKYRVQYAKLVLGKRNVSKTNDKLALPRNRVTVLKNSKAIFGNDTTQINMS